MVIAKNIALRESVKLQLRVECFNLINHPNYNIIGRIINDPTTFGKVLNQLDPRQLQFGLKLVILLFSLLGVEPARPLHPAQQAVTFLAIDSSFQRRVPREIKSRNSP